MISIKRKSEEDKKSTKEHFQHNTKLSVAFNSVKNLMNKNHSLGLSCVNIYLTRVLPIIKQYKLPLKTCKNSK